MKKIQSFLNKSFFVLLIFFTFSEQSAEAESRILIQGWESYPPLTYMDSQNNLTGLDIEIVQEICRRTGYEVKYQEAPWARLLLWLKNGTIQIASSATKTSEREKIAYFSDPYYKESYIVFVRKGEAANYRIKGLQDLIDSSFRLGVIRANVYGAEFDQLIKDPAFSKHIEEVTSDVQNHKKLLSNRLDGFIEESSRMSTEGRKTGIYEKVEPLFVIGEDYMHFMFSKKSTTPEIAQMFNSELKKMRADGKYQELFKKYKLDQFNMLND